MPHERDPDSTASITALTEDARYRLLVEAVTDYAIYMIDPDGIVTSWNAGAQRLKGYTAREILGRNFSCFYTEADREAGLPARVLGIAAADGRFEAEGWRVRKNGSRFWAHVVIDAIRSPRGGLLGFAKITRDRSEHKAAEEALRRSEETFKLLVQSVTDYAIYMIDPDGFITSWNAGAQRIKGYLPGEIIGQHFSRFYSVEDRDRGEPQRGLQTAAREGRFEKEGWRIRKDGSRFWANVVIDAIRDDSGALIGYAKVTRDITERLDAQHALEQAREALFQTQKIDALGRLTGGIAHDFNNLLMVVLGSLELARKRLPPDSPVVRLLDTARQGAQRGHALTQRMLAFARTQALTFTSVDLPGLVRGMADLLQRSLGATVWIDTRFPLDLPTVRADTNQLELALLNLTMNARDAMDGGAIVIAARAQDVATGQVGTLKPGRYVCLSVTDKGKGMDVVTLSRAVEPFFTTKAVGKGTGLGLSMVHGLTEQSGGQFILRSVEGEGTTAELWLPVAKAGGATDDADSQADAADGGSGQRKLVVLAVDDDNLVLMNTVAMLEDLGHTVFGATSGMQALDILRRDRHIDLLLTDQAMPRMTGMELIAAAKAEWPNLPVILATGYTDLATGAHGTIPLLAKPFSEDDLRRVIARMPHSS